MYYNTEAVEPNQNNEDWPLPVSSYTSHTLPKRHNQKHINQQTEPVKIKRGVRQGCVLSPVMFNLYIEHIFRKTYHIPGVKINEHNNY